MTPLDVLGKDHALELLIMIGDTPGPITHFTGGVDRTKYKRVRELESVGLVDIDETRRVHNTKLCTLTPCGMIAYHAAKILQGV